MKRLIVIAGFIMLALAISLRLIARQLNDPRNALFDAHYRVTRTASELQQKIFIADLHADSLLWDRDLNIRSDRGHLDLPRLREGRVGLQVFSIVNDVPSGLNIESNPTQHFDNLALLSIAQWWPPRTWLDPFARTLWQAQKLRQLADTNKDLLIIKNCSDLQAWQHRRAAGENVVAALLSIEGAQPLVADIATGNLQHLDALYAAGVRMVGLTHFFDNGFAGSAHGEHKSGLTPAGQALVAELERRAMLIDLAHVSPTAFDDVLKIATRPVVVSHTGVKATCDNRRNLSDDQLRRVAQNGGVVGIGFWDIASCGRDANSIARAVRHALSIMGPAHVALGSDFDGSVTVPFDAGRYAELTSALLDAGIDQATVTRVMGTNTLDLLERALP